MHGYYILTIPIVVFIESLGKSSEIFPQMSKNTILGNLRFKTRQKPKQRTNLVCFEH